MDNLRMLAVGRIWQGEIFIASLEPETGTITCDPTYVPDRPAFLEHATQAEIDELAADYESDIEDREWHSRGQW